MRLLDVDQWQEIFESLRRHKLRTLLTGFGVFWGIFMLVNLLGAGKGLKHGADANMGRATNSVILWAGRPTSIPFRGLTTGRRVALSDADVLALKEKIPEIALVSPRNGMGTQFTSYQDKGDSFEINGIIPEQQHIRGYELVEGRFLNQLDQLERRKVIVIGERVKEVLFGDSGVLIGESVKILGVSFTVVGVMKPSALNSWAQQDNSKILLPHSTIRKAYNHGDRIHSMYIVPKPGVSSYDMEKKIITTLQEKHKIHPKDLGVIGSYNTQKDFDRINGLFSGITIFSWFVAIGTIIAGAVGVGNIMLISVKERTREIGIRKALGATPASLIGGIILESLVITLFSGYLGLVAGVLSVELLDRVASNSNGGYGTFLNPEISFSTAFFAIAVLLAAGVLAAVLPAKKAASVDPVIALQG